MRRVFVDTSAFYAAIDRTDAFHQQAFDLFVRSENEGWSLITTNYIMHEAWSLVQRRLGWNGADEFLKILLPKCEIKFIDRDLFERGAKRCRDERLRLLSSTDCISFAFLETEGISEVMVFDAHFTAARFTHPQ